MPRGSFILGYLFNGFWFTGSCVVRLLRLRADSRFVTRYAHVHVWFSLHRLFYLVAWFGSRTPHTTDNYGSRLRGSFCVLRFTRLVVTRFRSYGSRLLRSPCRFHFIPLLRLVLDCTVTGCPFHYRYEHFARICSTVAVAVQTFLHTGYTHLLTFTTRLRSFVSRSVWLVVTAVG